MEYYKFTKEEKEEYIEKTILQTNSKYSLAKSDTTYFSVNSIGLKPLLWQSKFFKLFDSGKKRIAVCTPRQVGKSVAVAVMALKAALLNTAPAGVSKKTMIGIISATEEQSKKLMAEIKRIIQLGDQHVKTCTGGKQKKWFTNLIDASKSASNNKSMITFTNGNQIVCLPPTNRVRGYSFSYVFVDEAAFVEDQDIFFDSIEPTVSNTNGTIILTSTPNGQQGFFYDLFDPEEKYDFHEYTRFWLHYLDLDNQDMIDNIEIKKQNYYQTGKEKHFEQEYDAKFTVQVSAFFDSGDVDEMVELSLFKLSEYGGQCDCAIDFGMVNSHTVVTITRLNDEGFIERLFHHRYMFGADDALLVDLEMLKKKFNIQRFIPDDCPQGYHTIQKMEEKGWNVKPMSFKRDKVSKYVEFRSWLRQKKVKTYKDVVLSSEMKALQEEESIRTTKIHKPNGGTDDLIDCFVMSAYFYLERTKEDLKVYSWDEI